MEFTRRLFGAVDKFKAELTELRDLKLRHEQGKLPCPKCAAREAEDLANAQEREHMI